MSDRTGLPGFRGFAPETPILAVWHVGNKRGADRIAGRHPDADVLSPDARHADMHEVFRR